MLRQTLFIGTIALSVLAGACDGSTNISIDNLTGTIEGIVRDALDGTPVAGATIVTEPATAEVTSDATGHFSLDVEAGRTYTVLVSKQGYESASAQVELGSTGLSDFVDLRVRDPAKRLPGARGAELDVRSTLLDFDSQSTNFQVEIVNSLNTPISNVIVTNRLDAIFGAVPANSIEINSAAFPNAVLTMNADRSFSVSLGTVQPTAFVRAFTFIAPLSPIPGVHCSYASVRGGLAEEFAQNHTACLYRSD